MSVGAHHDQVGRHVECVLVENVLDPASGAGQPVDRHVDPVTSQVGRGGKLGLDATRKLGTETEREWGRVLDMPAELVSRVDRLWGN
ncbi:hypothetical protein ATC00_21360 [Sinorhizobium americanum]|nr:hypothetical protein ATC00_21360 [Sinorhizobium americanum]